ncbi:MAG: UDP-N-acetylmuramate--L-alanine ligase [Deltaproteobacteria bacterium]|nr:UDP-N-acetylmuramate--L-alanine ligase [Deltaproteobacteria bacterium]
MPPSSAMPTQPIPHELPDASRPTHFLGAGGIGMSGLAELLHHLGYRVSGSDQAPGGQLDRLAELNIPVWVGHGSAPLEQAGAVVYSSAVRPDNPVWAQVQRLGLPRYHRSQVLGALTRRWATLAVAGTHGKTTSSAWLAGVLRRGGINPNALVGGVVRQFQGRNLLVGDTSAQGVLVAEADESDGSFVNMSPQGVLLTNLEEDHLDHHGTLAELKAAFRAFLERIPPGGLLVYGWDDPGAREAAAGCKAGKLSYGLGPKADVRAQVLSMAPGRMEVRLDTPWGPLTVVSPLGGEQNAQNMAGVAATALGWTRRAPTLTWGSGGENLGGLAQALGEFSGVDRRQQFLGTWRGLHLFDDYAHHPTEVRVTLEGFLRMYGSPLTVVFQPHLYSRTQHFAQEFAQALAPAQHVFVTDVYGAREAPVPGIDARTILDHLPHHPSAHRLAHWRDLLTLAQNGSLPTAHATGLLVTMGAGDIWKLGPELMGTAP